MLEIKVEVPAGDRGRRNYNFLIGRCLWLSTSLSNSDYWTSSYEEDD